MKCPHCKAYMSQIDHGICPKCKGYCGCSFDPTSKNDFCSDHNPWKKKKKKKK